MRETRRATASTKQANGWVLRKPQTKGKEGRDGGSREGPCDPNARRCGGFSGFREKEKRGKNMGRSEEGKNVGARGRPQILLSQSSVLGH